MVIAVADLDGSLLALYRMPDSTVFSIDVAVAKSRNVIFFSTNSADLPGIPNGTAVTNRTIGFGAQPLFPPGIDSKAFKVKQGPFYPLFLKDLNKSLHTRLAINESKSKRHRFFPGATPLYRAERSPAVSASAAMASSRMITSPILGAAEFLPPTSKWADRVSVDKVRLPMFKFPRHPEGVTECGGKHAIKPPP